LQAYLGEINYEISKIKLILDAIPSGSGSGSVFGSLLTLTTINARDVNFTNPINNYTSNLEVETNMARNNRELTSEKFNSFV
jgi:hypothetical protein